MRGTRSVALLLALPALMAKAAPADLQRCMVAAADREALSGSILITQRDRVLASVLRGHQAGPDSRPIDRPTRFNLGSASKMFTAVAIGQLIDAGLLRLDEPVGELVNGLSPNAAKVTIRQLLTHSSGLGDFFKPENMAAMIRARTAGDILPLIASDRPAFPPGSRFAYSNSGFALLGIIVERVSHLTYADYLRRHIFMPAGMTSTGVDPQPLATLAIAMTQGAPASPAGTLILMGSDGKRIATSPHGSAPPRITDNMPAPTGHGDPSAQGRGLFPAPGATEGYGSPAGGLFSTGEDMQRFAAALLAEKLLSAATTRLFTSPHIEVAPATAERPARAYGFGFGIAEEGGSRWIGHNGGTLGANAEFSIQPDQQWVISVLANRDPPVATNLMRQAKALLLNPGLLAAC